MHFCTKCIFAPNLFDAKIYFGVVFDFVKNTASGKQMKKVKDHTQDKQKQVKLIKKACSKLITPLWT